MMKDGEWSEIEDRYVSRISGKSRDYFNSSRFAWELSLQGKEGVVEKIRMRAYSTPFESINTFLKARMKRNPPGAFTAL